MENMNCGTINTKYVYRHYKLVSALCNAGLYNMIAQSFHKAGTEEPSAEVPC